MQKLLGWAPGTKVIFQGGDGLPRVHCDFDVAAQFCNAPGLQHGNDKELAFGSESATEVQEMEDEASCSFAPPPPHKRR